MNKQIMIVMLALVVELISGRASAFEARQFFREERTTRGDVNLRPLQPIDEAAWIWMKGAAETWGKECPVVRFRRAFKSDGSKLVIDVSADPRFVLLLDGKEISRGPHKGFLEHWYYQSYTITGLAAGEHTLEAVVFHLGKYGPHSILSSGRGGFILKAEGAYDAELTTGKAQWQAAKVDCMRYGGITDPDTMTGAENIVRGTGFLDWNDLQWQPVAVRKPPVKRQYYGFHKRDWALFPTERLDELSIRRTPGTIRAARLGTNGVYAAGDTDNEWTKRFSGLLKNGTHVTIPANTTVQFLWDLGDYYCAFPELTVGGHAGRVTLPDNPQTSNLKPSITWSWAESLYSPYEAKANDPVGTVYLHKGNRNEVVGKRVLRSMRDTFLPDGRDRAVFTTPWWKCGRFCEITVNAAAEPMVLKSLAITETRYPMEPKMRFACDDASLDGVQRIAFRGMQNCMHEMFMDCPYYEQQMYPGDTRVEMLILNSIYGDDRLLRYGIGIFDYSRRHNGMIRMNFPSHDGQDSTTYSMCWVAMLGDYALWHGANEFLKDRIPGLRHTLSQIDRYRTCDGLLEKLPGWSFEDWPEAWGWYGVAPDGYDGCNAVDNLLYVYALKKAAEAERACGDAVMADYWLKRSDEVAAAVKAKFFVASRSLLADDVKREKFSEHAQCLALLSGVFPEAQAREVFKALVAADDLVRTTVYFSHYLFETYLKFGRTDLFLKRLDLWRGYVKDGLCTPPEAPGLRGRSDCHAWGAHPLYHLVTGVAGVRPAANGYGRVLVSPQPGGLKFVKATCPTPKGLVYVDLKFTDGKAVGSVVLPPGLTGDFEWRGVRTPLKVGMNEFRDPIRNYADGKRVVWIDFGDRLLEPDGSISKEMMPDFLHPRERGYDIWLKAIESHLE